MIFCFTLLRLKVNASLIYFIYLTPENEEDVYLNLGPSHPELDLLN